MEILNEEEITMVKMEFDMTEMDVAILLEHAKKIPQNKKEELLMEWAVNNIIEAAIDDEEFLKELKKDNKSNT